MRWRVLAAVLCGVILSLTFDPVGVPWLAPPAVAGLFVLAHRLRRSSWRDSAVVGVSFGIGFMAPLIWWMNAVSHGAYVALVIVEALWFGAIMLGLRSAARLSWWPVAMPLAWVLGEFLRSTLPFTGFPWGRLAYLTVDTPLAGYARLLGPAAASAIVCGLAAAITWLVVRPGVRRWSVLAGVGATVIVGALLPTGLVGGDGGPSAEIALVQGNIPGDFLTWQPGDIFLLHAAETDRLVASVASGKQPRPDVVLWPENATDVDPFHDSAEAGRIERLSAKLNAPILVGGIFDGPTVTTAYNAGVVWTPDGPEERYVKRKVVPYGEYVPFRQVLGRFVPKFDRFIPRDMLPGDDPNVLSAGPVRFGDTICWDIAFDGLIREAVNGGAQLLVVQTSNASFTGTAQPDQQFQISRLRAIETGRWVLIPSTNGITAIVDASGHPVARAPMHNPAFLSASVPLASGRTPAVLIGPWLEYLLVAGGLVAATLGWRRS